MPAFTERTTVERTLLAQMGFVPSAIESGSGELPHFFWVSPGGADGIGDGSMKKPFLTHRRAIRQTRDARGDFVLGSPGSYAETIDIGASGTGSGENGGYAKRNLKIIATGGGHSGLTQIIGDGSTAQPTIRVQSGYLRGFHLRGYELDTNTVAQPCLELVTSDTGALTATSSDYHAVIEDVHVNSNGTPTIGFLYSGATKVITKGCTIAGCVRGVGWRGSLNNNPDNLRFLDMEFWDNVTADVISCTNNAGATATTNNWAHDTVDVTNIQFWRPRFWDRGGTPVTNYAQIAGTTVGCGFWEFVTGRDVADGTLMALPANWTAIGRSALEAEFLIGA